jgi:charged multivesicular body protein 6
MKIQRDKLRQYQKRITVLTDREKAIAKQCLAKGDMGKAKLALRRKKYQEGLIAKTDAQLAQLEQLTSDVEFALVQKDVVFGLQQGTAVLKEIHREMGGIENVEKLLGENEEARAYQEVRCAGPSPRPLTDISRVHRKSASCSQTRCRTRTKTRSRTNSRRSRKRSTLPPRSRVNYPIAPKEEPVFTPAQKAQIAKDRAQRRARERAAEQAPQPMLA